VLFPSQVVIRTGRIGDAPKHHGAIGIDRKRLLEAFDAFIAALLP
jgi:hypothetical protein